MVPRLNGDSAGPLHVYAAAAAAVAALELLLRGLWWLQVGLLWPLLLLGRGSQRGLKIS